MHVLTLTPFYPSETDDASGCFVSEPLNYLANLGIRNTIMAVQPFYRRRLRAGGESCGGEWLRYFSLPSGFGLPTAGVFLFARALSHLRTLHGSQPVDLIHAHGALPCGHAAMLLSIELNIPYVISVHGLDAYSTQQVKGFWGEWCHRISRRVFGFSNRVICVSERVREAVWARMERKPQTSVLYNGVNSERFSPVPENPNPKLKILSVGNLIPIKGHEDLIRALSSLVRAFPTVQLEIIGDGPERERLMQLAENYGVAANVQFLGRQTRSQVALAMQNCAIFALPSRYEGLGCVYLEAMACGKPTIGCREQGIAEIIDHGVNGFLVGPGGNDELAVILEKLLRDPHLRSVVGGNARNTILNRLTMDKQAVDILEIYRECVQ